VKLTARVRYWCVFMLLLLIAVNAQSLAVSTIRSAAIDFSELDKLVPEELKEKNTPGAVITVISGDQVVYQKAFGVANVETGAPMETQMLFRLGSTTKMFTAAALATLAEQNKINLNEPIGNRIKGLSPRIAKVTADHLLSNSAGVRENRRNSFFRRGGVTR